MNFIRCNAVSTHRTGSRWRPWALAEIRIRTGAQHRIVYVAKFEEGVYVLHAFEKKSRRTSASDLDLARGRLKEILQRRRGTVQGNEVE